MGGRGMKSETKFDHVRTQSSLILIINADQRVADWSLTSLPLDTAIGAAAAAAAGVAATSRTIQRAVSVDPVVLLLLSDGVVVRNEHGCASVVIGKVRMRC